MYGRLRALFVSLCLVLGACGSHHKQGSDAPPRPTAAPVTPDDERVPVGPTDPVRGTATAYVTVVVFGDLICPDCTRLAGGIDKLREAYPADVLRLVFKAQPSPNLPHAKLAATVGQGVFELKGSEGFWKYRGLAVRDAQSAGVEAVRRWAMQAGLSAPQIDTGLERGAWADKVERDMAVAKRLGVVEPPTTFINGVPIAGAPSYDQLKAIVEVELAKAKTLEQSGVPRDKIYGQAVAANASDPRVIAARDKNELEDPRAVWKVPVGSSPVRGRPTALVTIVEFSDFDCAACKRATQIIDKIRAAYGERVRVVWKDLPPATRPRASAAMYLARAARAQRGDTGFWDMHDRLFTSAQLDEGDLEMLARAANLDVRAALLAAKNQVGKKEVELDRELADDVDVLATPQLFVNGRRLIGEQPFERVNAIVEEETHKAEALLKSGVEATGLYDWFIKDGRPGDPMRKIIPWPLNAPAKGSAMGPIIIQEFASLPCIVCKRADPMIDEVMKAYPNQVRFVWRDMPNAVDAELAAEAARQAYAEKGTDAFWKMEGRLVGNPTILSRPDLEAAGIELSLDSDKLKKALDGRTHKPTVDIDVKAAKEAGLTTNPTFVIGQYVFSGVPSLARFLRYAGRALAEAPVPPRAQPQAPSNGRPAGPTVAARFGWVDILVGKGEPAESGDIVTVHYRARVADGGEFDNTYKRGAVSFMIGSGAVIGGLDRGTTGMRVGGKRRITIPPELGFGNHGIGKTIPVNAVIVMEVELLKITKQK